MQSDLTAHLGDPPHTALSERASLSLHAVMSHLEMAAQPHGYLAGRAKVFILITGYWSISLFVSLQRPPSDHTGGGKR